MSLVTWRTASWRGHGVKNLLFVVMIANFCVRSFGAESPKLDLRLKFPATFYLSKNEVDAIHVDVGSGISADLFMLRWKNWHFGPGISLVGTVPTSPGNRTVLIKPYRVFSELRIVGALDLTKYAQGLMPHFAVGGQLGSIVVAKAVNKSRRTDAELMFGGVINAGLSYWWHQAGFGFSYGLSASNNALHHQLEVSLQYALSPNF